MLTRLAMSDGEDCWRGAADWQWCDLVTTVYTFRPGRSSRVASQPSSGGAAWLGSRLTSNVRLQALSSKMPRGDAARAGSWSRFVGCGSTDMY